MSSSNEANAPCRSCSVRLVGPHFQGGHPQHCCVLYESRRGREFSVGPTVGPHFQGGLPQLCCVLYESRRDSPTFKAVVWADGGVAIAANSRGRDWELPGEHAVRRRYCFGWQSGGFDQAFSLDRSTTPTSLALKLDDEQLEKGSGKANRLGRKIRLLDRRSTKSRHH